MKIKPGYILRKVVDIYVIIGVGEDAYQPDVIMSLNETGAFLWEILIDGAEYQDLVTALMKEYDEIDQETAKNDVDAFLDQLRKQELIDL